MERARAFSGLAKELTTNHKRLLIAVDGPAGSGKTTFANALSSYLPFAEVVHMDEIYNGWDDALTSNLSSNLFAWLIEPFLENKEITHPVFDWHKNTYSQTKSLGKRDYLILEGVGSGNSDVFNALNYLVWVETDLDLGLTRVKNRDGEKVAAQMIRWREKEADWFLAHKTREKAHLLVNGNPPLEIDINKEFWLL